VRWFQSLEILVWLEKCAGGQRDSDTYQERECCGVLHLSRQLIGCAKYQGYLQQRL